MLRSFVTQRWTQVCFSTGPARRMLEALDDVRSTVMSLASIRSNVMSLVSIVDDGFPSVKIGWQDGGHDTFAAIHLRDCCRCPLCFDSSSSQQRLANIVDIVPLDVRPYDVSIQPNGVLRVIWPDGHRSSFTRQRLAELAKPSLKPGTNFFGCNFVPEKFIFNDVVNDKEAMKSFLKNLKTWGLCVLNGVPRTEGQVDLIGNIISQLRATHYGRTFQVKSKQNPSNLAYTSGGLALHTDLPFYNHVPGIQMLHCIKAATHGGANVFSDGFNISEILRRSRPDSFRLLSETFWKFYDIATENSRNYHMKYQDAIIGLDDQGNYMHFKYNNQSRDDLEAESYDKMYSKYKAFYDVTEALRRPETQVRLKMDAGQCVVFDNTRVLHGREEYIDVDGQRHLEGAYLDWDEVDSFIRAG